MLPAIILAACAGRGGEESAASAAEQDSPAPPAMTARKEVPAPIESAEVQVRESAPPRYALRIVSGLPSGCAQHSRIEVKREGDTIDVTVWNTVPADSNVACTMIYGTSVDTAELGSDFESGRTYTVNVNGEQKASFTAQ